MEASQEHICSLLLNKCHDRTRIKTTKDWEKDCNFKRDYGKNVIINDAPGPKY